MKLTSASFNDNEPIPGQFAFCVADPESHATLGSNRNPAFQWSDLPQGTRSLVLLCHDPDVPSKPDDVNQEGRAVPADLPRIDFYHWVLLDLAPQPAAITEGEFSDGVTAGGKSGPGAPRDCRQGVNSYTDWFAGDEDMQGNYYGYDGPCPPWNDTIVHHYIFTLYALDVDRCPVDGDINGPSVLGAIEGHVLGKARVTGTYSLNPNVS